MEELRYQEIITDDKDPSHQSGATLEEIWRVIVSIYFSNYGELNKENMFFSSNVPIAEVDCLFIVQKEIPSKVLENLLNRGGKLIYPELIQPIKVGVISVETSNFFLHENDFSTQKKIEEEIQTQIIKDIEKFDKIEALQSFQNLMYKSAPKKLVQQRITIFFIFNGADPSVHQSQIKKK